MGDKIQIRIPVLENTATQYGTAFSQNARPLRQSEIAIARTIFRNSIRYADVQVVHASVAAAPTTLGNAIRVQADSQLSNPILIHELTHVWQFQTNGNSYISNSVVNQTVGTLMTGDRNAAYEYEIIARQSIRRYSAEQQAMIVEDYYRCQASIAGADLTRKIRENLAEYERMIAEVRRAVPQLTNMDRYLESLYGSQYQQPGYLDTTSPSGLRPSEIAPIFRIEF